MKQEQITRPSYNIDYHHLEQGKMYVCYLSLTASLAKQNNIVVMFDEPFFLVNKFGIDGEMTILTKEGIRTATISIHANNPLFKEI
jgi:hypothetical protein